MSRLIDHPNAVAVVGMACRFPGAATVRQFWENLRGGVESTTFFTDEELLDAGIPQAALAQADYVRAKPLVTGIEHFDAAFFGLTPREAALMDPQHRIFLECASEALESAGHDPDRFPGRIGVYGGANLSSYLLFNLLSNPEALFSLGGVGGRTGVDKDFLTTQVSYRLNLRGPSFAVQTACSTSLVAVHVACQQLLDGECDMALAGGVGINLPHRSGYLYQEGSIYSPDGHCRAFDADAEGTLLGDGAGIVVLRRLADALADGDPVHAVIRGSAINNDGSTKVGFSAPSVDSQAEVITEALALAKVSPDTVTYVEAHGTATRMGDPIEVTALSHAFRAGTDRKGFCGLGSVKTNFGHLDAAAGAAGLIKTVLALKNRQVPASLHFRKPNPQIDFANSPFFVNAELRDWSEGPEPRRAGVSSFGVGGTNAHAVLEEAPPREPSGPSRPWQVLPLSAKTPTALDAATANLARFLAEHPEVPLADVAFTLQSGRRAFPHRRIVVCSDRDGAVAALQALDPARTATSAAGAHARSVAFLFPGQGAQHVNMARDLYESEAAFRQELDRCVEILQPHLELDLRTVLYPAPGGEEEAGKLLEQTRLTQPALFAVEYALARLWMSWGIAPQALIGHSVGEYVAACLAGVFSLEDALALVAARGRLIQGLPAGAMLAVPLPEAEVAPRLAEAGDGLSLAAVNGPGFCVVSGPEEPVEALRKILDGEGVECTRLHTSHAFHSEMMDPILGPFAERVGRVRLSAPKIPYLSNVTGTWITEAEATDPGYWTRHIRQTVRFADGLAALLEDPDRVLLEVGPGQSLTTLARQMPAMPAGGGARAADRVAIPSLRRPKEDGPDLPRVLHALGRLWAAGVKVDWSAFTGGENRHRVELPTYPFERERFWVDPVSGGVPLPSAPLEAGGTTPGHALVKQEIDRWFYVPAWKQADRLGVSTEEEAPSSWLLFLPEQDGFGHRLAERLRERGDTVVTAVPGDAFAAREDGAFTLRPAERKDYDALFKEIRTRKAFPRGVPDRAVHLWNLAPGDGTPAVPFYSLLYLVQTLGEEAAGEAVRLAIVSSGVQAVTGDEEIEPEKALLLGFCRVVPQESPNLAVQSLDVTVPAPGSHAERHLLDRLLAEIEGEAPHELADRAVAFRGRHRWVLGYEPAALDERFSQAPRLRPGGVFLLTGGLDPTTLAFARHLAGLGGKLAITVPPGFPERERWEALTASPAGGHDPVRRTVEAVRELEGGGAEVLLIPVDLAGGGREAAEEAVDRTLERFGALHGVLHVEMFPGAGLIQLKTPELSDPVLRPRVMATRALADVLTGKLNGAGLDFFALFASTIGVTGGLGQIDFSAANNYLDAFAHQQRSQGGLPAVTIDWGAFRWEEWQQMLGGGQTAMQAEMQKSIEAFGIDVPESLEAFRRVLAAGVPQVVVSTGDLGLVLRQHDLITAQLMGQQPGAGGGQHHARPALSSQYVAPASDVEAGIANIWQDLLGIAPIGVQDNFFELAGNSLTAIQIITRVRKAFDVDVSMSAIFEAPTVGGLARIVQAGQLGEEALAEVDGILDEIENLSPEELERLLAEEMESGGTAHGG